MNDVVHDARTWRVKRGRKQKYTYWRSMSTSWAAYVAARERDRRALARRRRAGPRAGSRRRAARRDAKARRETRDEKRRDETSDARR
eukprot:798-Pelagococcus_subviridis.AAC.4